MHNPPWLVLVLGLFLAGTHADVTAEPDELDASLDAFYTTAFALEMTPGMAVAVVRGDEVVYSRGFGFADVEAKRPVTPETLFYIASTTKSFTAFAATLLAFHGELDLEAPIARYLPSLRLRAPLSPDSITLRDLLSLRHGIEEGGPVVFRTAFSGEHDPEQLVALLADYKPASTGRTFEYGNLGYNMAGMVLDAAIGVGWKEVLQQRVFTPAGMLSTTAFKSRVPAERLALPYAADVQGFRRLYDAKDDSNMHAAGGHLSTVLDLARWVGVHLNQGRWDGRQVFPAQVVAATHEQQVGQDRKFGPYERHGWGLGWDLGTYEGDLLVHRFGTFSGFRSHVSFMPERGVGVVVLVNNATPATFLADLVACYAYDLLLGKPDLGPKYGTQLDQYRTQVAQMRQGIAQDKEKRAARSQKLPYSLAAYAGDFTNPAMGTMHWEVVQEHLEVRMGVMWSPVEVYSGDDNQLRIELTGSGTVVKFTLDGARAASLVWDGNEYVRVADGR